METGKEKGKTEGGQLCGASLGQVLLMLSPEGKSKWKLGGRLAHQAWACHRTHEIMGDFNDKGEWELGTSKCLEPMSMGTTMQHVSTRNIEAAQRTGPFQLI